MRDVEKVIELVLGARPDVEWKQLQVAHPGADDDGIWFFHLRGSSPLVNVQIESSTGMSPFLVEGGSQGPATIEDVDLVADAVLQRLGEL